MESLIDKGIHKEYKCNRCNTKTLMSKQGMFIEAYCPSCEAKVLSTIKRA